MSDPTVRCPECGAEIRISEQLAAPYIEAARRAGAEAAAEAERERVARELAERDQAIAEMKRKNDELAAREKSADEKLAAAAEREAKMIKSERELKDREIALEAEIQKKITEEAGKIKAEAAETANREWSLRLDEKDKRIADMAKTIAELKEKSELTSQQLQGEVLELRVEDELRERYPTDSIEPVPKGVSGADVVQRVHSRSGTHAGTIAWEIKRTKNWQPAWLQKLREDARAIKADVAVIVSTALPDGIDSFGLVDDVWVVAPRFAVPVAAMLRQAVINVQSARRAAEGQGTKAELVYSYITGPSFRARVAALAETYSTMRADLEKERNAMTRLWSKREKQIETVMMSLSGMYGDMQGIAGQSMAEIDGMTLALEEPED